MEFKNNGNEKELHKQLKKYIYEELTERGAINFM